MNRLFVLSLAAAAVAAGCTVVNSDNPSTNPDGGSNTTEAPDAQAPDTDGGEGGGKDGGVQPGQEVDEVAGNDAFESAQAVPPGGLVKAAIAGEEEDFFSVTIPAGNHDGVLRLSLNETSPDWTPRIEIYQSDRTYIERVYANDATATPLVNERNVTAGKLYYVRVDNGSNGKTIPYTLDFGFTAVADPSERNDTFETAKPAPVGQFDLFLFAGVDTNKGADIDFFTIDVPNGKKVRVHIENKSTAEATQRHRVDVYDANKGYIARAYASGPQANLDTTFEIPTAGKVYVKFDDTDNSPVPSKATITLE